VSDADGEIDLAVTSLIEGMPITHSTIVVAGPDPERAHAPQRTTRRVPMISLDPFMSRRSDAGPFLLKVDIDGHELKVLKGAEQFLARCAAVVIELHTTDFFERSAFLLDRRFRLFDIVDLCYYDERLSQVDGVFFNPRIMGELDMITEFDLTRWQDQGGLHNSS
jgi:hypothetical protein